MTVYEQPRPLVSRRERDILALRLAPMGQEHVAAWQRWREQPSSQRFNPLLTLTTAELSRHLTNLCTSDLSNRTLTEYRWVAELDGEPVGAVTARNPSWGMGYVEIGYMMSETHHGRGLGTRAVALLVDKLFRETDLHRLYAMIATGNVASIKLVERLGFVHEGRMREHYAIQGRRVDEDIYGLLRHEWRPL